LLRRLYGSTGTLRQDGECNSETRKFLACEGLSNSGIENAQNYVNNIVACIAVQINLTFRNAVM
jgi:hypothetical protein